MAESIEQLSCYLDRFLFDSSMIKFPRVDCCGTSKSLYCTECFQLLVDKTYWPNSILDGHLKLPFALDIILDDRRRSSSSLHAIVLLKAALACRSHLDHNDSKNDSNMNNDSNIRLIDIQRQESIPSDVDDFKGTYLLFPSNDSIPLSSVIEKVSKLVVLDCKWTKCMSRTRDEIRMLPKVHLDTRPKDSFFWRWHNAGEGMVSTMEAIYFAAVQVGSNQPHFTVENERALIDIMWLFGIQRALTTITVERDGRPCPFTTDGKELQRSYRRPQHKHTIVYKDDIINNDM